MPPETIGVYGYGGKMVVAMTMDGWKGADMQLADTVTQFNGLGIG